MLWQLLFPLRKKNSVQQIQINSMNVTFPILMGYQQEEKKTLELHLLHSSFLVGLWENVSFIQLFVEKET